jgi:hypothetical protein
MEQILEVSHKSFGVDADCIQIVRFKHFAGIEMPEKYAEPDGVKADYSSTIDFNTSKSKTKASGKRTRRNANTRIRHSPQKKANRELRPTNKRNPSFLRRVSSCCEL